MKTILVLILSFLSVSALQAQTDSQAVEAADQQFETGFATKSAEVMFAPVAADCIFYGTDPTERWDLVSFRAMIEIQMKNGMPAMNVIARDISFLAKGKVAIVVKKINWVVFKSELREVVVYEKQKNGWKMKTFSLNLAIPNQKTKALNEMLVGK
jgi:ketosteroid isomerase-like protein